MFSDLFPSQEGLRSVFDLLSVPSLRERVPSWSTIVLNVILSLLSSFLPSFPFSPPLTYLSLSLLVLLPCLNLTTSPTGVSGPLTPGPVVKSKDTLPKTVYRTSEGYSKITRLLTPPVVTHQGILKLVTLLVKPVFFPGGHLETGYSYLPRTLPKSLKD